MTHPTKQLQCISREVCNTPVMCQEAGCCQRLNRASDQRTRAPAADQASAPRAGSAVAAGGSFTSNQLSQICSCTWVEGLREPGIDCPVHPRPAGSKERFRKVESNIPWRLVPCRLCGSPAELWQRWRRDDVWDSFGACTNLEDVDGEACLFHLPDDPHFYRDRKTDAVRHWNLMMGPRTGDSSAPETPNLSIDLKSFPIPWRIERGNSPIADTGDYDGVTSINAANGVEVVVVWNASDEQEEAFERIVRSVNGSAPETNAELAAVLPRMRSECADLGGKYGITTAGCQDWSYSACQAFALACHRLSLKQSAEETAAPETGEQRQWVWFTQYYGSILQRIADGYEDPQGLAIAALNKPWSAQEISPPLDISTKAALYQDRESQYLPGSSEETGKDDPESLAREDARLYGSGFVMHTPTGAHHIPTEAVSIDRDKLKRAEKTSPPHPGPSIEKAFARSPRRIDQPEKASEQECRSAGPSGNAAGTGPVDPGAEARSSRREVTAQKASVNPYCLQDGVPCASDGRGGCLACVDEKGTLNGSAE